ncbi:MAG: hypothetical protein FE78DRAFT_314463 [Acidomyces sp. 'richmondensis']|nr:MAG: hypothetical protein FE78DRAFT_314463 [Acidomyces sp. 'richmondensis']
MGAGFARPMKTTTVGTRDSAWKPKPQHFEGMCGPRFRMINDDQWTYGCGRRAYCLVVDTTNVHATSLHLRRSCSKRT